MVDAKSLIGPSSRYREAAIKLLGAGKPGDQFTIDQLIEGLDAKDISHKKMVAAIRSARLHLERNSIAWWKWSKDFRMLMCIDENSASVAMQSETRSLSRKALRTVRRASCVDAKKLSVDDRRQFDLAVVQAQMARISLSRKIGHVIDGAGRFEVPKIGNIEELFRK